MSRTTMGTRFALVATICLGWAGAYAGEAAPKDVAAPQPRFTVGASGNVVTDNLTGLMWAQNANPFGAPGCHSQRWQYE